MNKVLNNVLIQPDVLSKEGIDFLINHAKSTPSEHIGTFDMESMNKKRPQLQVEKIKNRLKCKECKVLKYFRYFG